MNEIDILDVFYDELRAEGHTRETLFLSIDDAFVAALHEKSGTVAALEDVQKLADICIANEWLERTTADPYYRYLSLTQTGLEMAIARHYLGNKNAGIE